MSIFYYNSRYPLHYASQDDQVDIMNLLLKNEAKVNAATAEGYTTLHIAAENGHDEAVSIKLIFSHCPNIMLESGLVTLTYC